MHGRGPETFEEIDAIQQEARRLTKFEEEEPEQEFADDTEWIEA
jgi:hypothetical protein